MSKNLLVVFLFLGTFYTLSAQKDESDKAVDSLVAQVKAVKFKTEGVVALADGKVNLNIPKGFKYLDAQQTHFVLEKLWGNPPQDDDGMLFPMDADLLQNTSWAFVIKYQKDGHIDDSDAAAIKYDELLTSMKESVKEESGSEGKHEKREKLPLGKRANHGGVWLAEVLAKDPEDRVKREKQAGEQSIRRIFKFHSNAVENDDE